MPFDTGIANRLRAAGIPDVREVSGWKTRGAGSSPSAFHPKGSVNHHTAGAPRSAGRAPSLGIIINGHSRLSGPLANVYMDYEGTVYVIAAGVAHHAGLPDGDVHKGMRGNSDAWGLEIEHPGTFPLDDERWDLAALVHAALIKGTASAKQVVQHFEWAPSRKIDLATNARPDAFRKRVAFYLEPPQVRFVMRGPSGQVLTSSSPVAEGPAEADKLQSMLAKVARSDVYTARALQRLQRKGSVIITREDA